MIKTIRNLGWLIITIARMEASGCQFFKVSALAETLQKSSCDVEFLQEIAFLSFS